VTPWQSAALERLNQDRDPAILLALAESGVLTTGQLCRLHFANLDVCRRRMRILRDLRLVTGFRPGGGRDAETCWTLAEHGAQLLSGILGEVVRAGAWGRNEASARALPHRRAVADFFMALAGDEPSLAGDEPSHPHLVAVRAGEYQEVRPAAAHEPSTLWLGERSCRAIFGDATRRPYGGRVALVPDGAARIGGAEASVPILVELDRGTEALSVLDSKLARYARMVSGYAVLVCFTDPAPARAAWRPLARPGMTVLVGDLDRHLRDPWGAVWTSPDGQCVAVGDLLAARAR
jgi:hypothetical protein